MAGQVGQPEKDRTSSCEHRQVKGVIRRVANDPPVQHEMAVQHVHGCSSLFAPSEVTGPVNEIRRYKANSATPPTIHAAAASRRRTQRCPEPAGRWNWIGGNPVPRGNSSGSASAAIRLLRIMARTVLKRLAAAPPAWCAETSTQHALIPGWPVTRARWPLLVISHRSLQDRTWHSPGDRPAQLSRAPSITILGQPPQRMVTSRRAASARQCGPAQRPRAALAHRPPTAPPRPSPAPVSRQSPGVSSVSGVTPLRLQSPIFPLLLPIRLC